MAKIQKKYKQVFEFSTFQIQKMQLINGLAGGI